MKLTWFKQTLLAKMTAIDRNNKQNQFYRKQARLSLNEGIQISRVRDKINREKESLTYVTTQFPTWYPKW